MTITATDAIEVRTRRSALNVTDPLSRAALTAQLADMQATLTGLDGLHAAAPDGLVLDRGISANLAFIQMAIADLARAIASGDLWMSADEAAALDRERRDFYAAYEANPSAVVPAGQYAQLIERTAVPA